MSDERDEAPRPSPSGDSPANGDQPADDATRVSGRAPVDEPRRNPPELDDTLPGNSRLDDTLEGAKSLDDLGGDVPGRPAPGGTAPIGTAPIGNVPGGEAATVADRRPDQTSLLPPIDDDWAPSRGNPAWSGRAEVRPRTQEYQEAGWDTEAPPREPRGRWYMPIVVGIVLVVLLGVLAWAIYLIAQNAGGDTPAPASSTTVATPSAAPVSTTPSSEPPTTETTTPPTTEPTSTEITVPALKGMSVQDATYALSQKGLKYRLIYVNNASPPGTVIDSDPPEGQEVPPDTAITLVIAKQATTVPTTSPTVTPTTTGVTDGPGADAD